MESRLGTTDVPPFMCSCTSAPFTRNPLAVSRCPLTDTLPAFSPPDGATVPVTPAMMTEFGLDGRDRDDAGLNRQQVGVTAAVQRERRHLGSRHDLAELGGRRFDADGVLDNRDGFRLIADLQRRVDLQRGYPHRRPGPSASGA